jgi:hypothetical protein
LVMAKILSFCWRMVTMPMTFSTMVIVRFEKHGEQAHPS